MEEGLKKDEGKLRYDLVPPYPLEELVKIYTVGSIKYGDRNWEKGIKFSRIFAAVMRHLWKFWSGEDNDQEDNLPHLSHAAWGCLTLLHYNVYNRKMDDRHINTRND